MSNQFRIETHDEKFSLVNNKVYVFQYGWTTSAETIWLAIDDRWPINLPKYITSTILVRECEVMQ